MTTVSLRRLLPAQFLVAAIVPFLAALLILVFWMRPYLTRESEGAQQRLALALALAQQTETSLNAAASTLAALVQGFPAIESAFSETVLESYVGGESLFEAVYLVRPDGRPIAVGLGGRMLGRRSELRVVDISNQALFLDVAKRRSPVWSDSFLSIVSRKATVAYGLPVGPYVMIAELSTSKLEQAIRNATVRHGGTLMLLDRNQRVVADNLGNFSGQQASVSNIGLLQNMGGAETIRTGPFEYLSKRYLGTVIPVRPVGWSVLVADLAEVVYEPLDIFIRILAASFGFAVLLGIGLAFGMAGTLGRSIGATKRHAERVAAGEYELRGPGTRVAEIRSINLAIDDIAGKVMNRESLLREANATLEARVLERTGQIQRANIDLEAANTDLKAFAYSVSHDLRGPLRSINGFAKILAVEHAPNLPPDARQDLGRIEAAAVRMSGLIDDMLKLFRVIQADLKLEPVDVSAAARQIVSRLGEDNSAGTAQWSIADNMRAMADPGMLNIVLENLLGNALKYSATMQAPVIAMHETAANDAFVEFCVRDNGVGFDMAHAAQLFKPFQRLHGRNEFEGNGIGLATVHRVLQRQGGTIRAEASVGNGAVFYFTLPTQARGSDA